MRGMILVAALAAGCGDDALDISGLYETSSHTMNDLGCTEGPQVADPPFFMVQKDEFFGQPFYVYGECTSSDPASCSSSGLFGLTFTQAQGDGYVGTLDAASGGGGTCSLTHIDMSAVLDETGAMRIEATTYAEDAMLADEQCTAEEAGARGANMPCVSFEAIEGTRIGDAPPPEG